MQRLKILAQFLRLRRWFAHNLGVSAVRKEQVYLDLAQSVTLTDASYWIQVLFSAGIATLGLVLNSPAVIIGAMLISPLMGSILANGLALAAGDAILALRALVNLILSCTLAISFAVVLVLILPFKEMTSEILARTQPNLLDLVIALFSGAVGAVAICKEAKGVVTSIPGVSIAVALMPPLCVVGYGIGMAVSLSPGSGLAVARGGGLLFFTNLVAITFMAMLVFLVLHIDSFPVRERVRLWRKTNGESIWMQSLVERIPASERLKRIGSLPSRLLLILMTILLTSIPLYQSYNQLRDEISRKQQENQLRNSTTEIWQKNFGNFPDGKVRSYISQLSFREQKRKLVAQLQVVTSKVYTEAEREQYKQLLSAKLGRPLESIALNLIQIPIASNELLPTKVSETTIKPEPPPTVAELQSSFLTAVESALDSLILPLPAQLMSYQAITSPLTPLRIQIAYFSPRDLDRDGQALLVDDIRSQLNYPTAQVNFNRIAPVAGTVTFALNQAQIPANQVQLLDRLGKTVQQNPKLQIEMSSGQAPSEAGTPAIGRSVAVRNYLQTKWQIKPDRYITKTETATQPIVQLKTVLKKPPQNSSPSVQQDAVEGGVTR
ncbi:DUF389 domain-containing protein [Tychonema sp. LEGE 07199]|uniref:DUF389 domain-containing protein n=1 Tax=unclassified Tychonema TaxID=2642144 RepID=UPI00188301C8|nr:MULTISPECIES: DUF389 domain-containing protein [unclassified Tychonema]MBE9123965.1 DUF389 domain-containing protein [Tychonema sp. LEGE 07199]MBE9134793.1 DUF389 domain-containing protein [Tychonema sp. LEGE 07196]